MRRQTSTIVYTEEILALKIRATESIKGIHIDQDRNISEIKMAQYVVKDKNYIMYSVSRVLPLVGTPDIINDYQFRVRQN